MSNQVTATRFQNAASLPDDKDFDALVGKDGVDVTSAQGCGSLHVERSADGHGYYDVKLNGQLLTHLSKDQIKGLHPEQCTGSAAQISSATLPSTVARTNLSNGGTRTEIKNFNPPGWEEAGTDHQACYKLTVKGADMTVAKGESATGGGGVILYPKVAGSISTNKDASAVALAQIKAHVDAGKALVAGANLPAITYTIDDKKQPVTDHFMDIYGYEADKNGKITAILAKDNAVGGAPTIRFEVNADGSIAKGGSVDPKKLDVPAMKYELSEVRFHTSMPYKGDLRPMDDAKNGMVWWPKT